ncbi:hypothetical protein ACB098_08G143100 [Castanea mollissima]
MKDLSFFLLKNSLGAKMKKGIRTNFCNDDGSTSTLNQQHNNKANHEDFSNMVGPFVTTNARSSRQSQTLEEMLLQLELEEEIARKSKLSECNVGILRGRMSCVNNSDILRSARNALNQYPRFSLDGKDAMYRSSFKKLHGIEKPGRKSSSNCCDFNSCKWSLPPTLAGERVVWCKPGVVAKLMGLEAMPVPILMSGKDGNKDKLKSIIKRQNLRRRSSVERHEDMEIRRMAMDIKGSDGIRRSGRVGSCSSSGYCVVKPVPVEPLPTRTVAGAAAAWPTRHFV